MLYVCADLELPFRLRDEARKYAADLASNPEDRDQCRDMAVAHELIALQIACLRRER
jgi:hypothetical protein